VDTHKEWLDKDRIPSMTCLYKDPDNHEEIQRMLSAKRSKEDNGDNDEHVIENELPEQVIDDDNLLVFDEQPA